jgi:integrase
LSTTESLALMICNGKCKPHVCAPLAPASILKVHWTVSGAMARAVRRRWIAVNPAELAAPPAPPKPHPAPPSPEDAARLLTAAWKDPAWGTFLWMACTTGPRRGEMCAIRRDHLDLDAATLTIDASVFGTRQLTKSKDTKSHQRRRIALDTATVSILRDHLALQDADAGRLGIAISRTAYLFSNDPDCARPRLPGSVSQRYDRLVERLGIRSSLHKLRHYNATELISAGVAGRSVLRRGLSPLADTISTPCAAPVLAAVRLRAGRAGSAKGPASMVTEAINTAKAAGAVNVLVRGLGSCSCA